MSERSPQARIEPSPTAQRRRGDRLRAAPTSGRATATLVTIARHANRDAEDADRLWLAVRSRDRLN